MRFLQREVMAFEILEMVTIHIPVDNTLLGTRRASDLTINARFLAFLQLENPVESRIYEFYGEFQ